MRPLLSVVGTRGDVQPVIALAIELRKRGAEARLCVPPNFVDSLRAMGFDARPVGIEMRVPRKGDSKSGVSVSVPDLITDQFESVGAAAKGCDIILGANAHQYAAPSIAEANGLPYVSAVYAPTALPSEGNTRTWNERALEGVNANRARLRLEPVSDVLSHIVTDTPWLAADKILAQPPTIPELSITQTGAWFTQEFDELPAEVQEFLESGEAPIYCGFGSMPVPEATVHPLLEAARLVGRRAIVAEGWGHLGATEKSPNHLFVSEVNHQALFPRLAAVVHHGGAGTTVTCARSGTPQVIVPMFSDQPYWANRVEALGIGSSVPFSELSGERLASVLETALQRVVAQKARDIAPQISGDGAARAAELLLQTA